MKTDNILVLGAGVLQLPLIKRIIQRGYNPVVVSLHETEPGMQLVTNKVVADFCNEEDILEIAQRYNVCGVVTDQTDLPVRTIAYVCERLKLPGIDYRTSCIFTDKYQMRKQLERLGLPVLKYALIPTYESALAFMNDVGGPIIIKPTNNQGSKGVYKISNDQELRKKYDLAVSYSRGFPVMAEEFVSGDEVVVEGVACDGFIDNLVWGDTFYFDIPDVFSAKQRIFPSKQPDQILEKIKKRNLEIIEGFGLKRGLTHAEYIIVDGEVYLIEIAARGGGVYISSDIIPLMTGFDTTNFIIDSAITDKTISLPRTCGLNKVVSYISFFLPEGIIVRLEGIKNVQSLPFVHQNNLNTLNVGKVMGPNTDKTTRLFIVLEAANYEEMEQRIDHIHSILSIETMSDDATISGIIWE